jgi:hypothetical protein
MKSAPEKGAGLYLALVHYPVLNRMGETIPAAVVNLDVHDLARLTRTFDLPGCFLVTPLEDQQDMVERLLEHWRSRVAQHLHPQRDEALQRIRIADSLRAALEQVKAEAGAEPLVWATSARNGPDRLSFPAAARELRENGRPKLLMLGTGWGLAPELLDSADAVLEPVRGVGEYNHLSVRCAAAIMIDRLLSGCAAPGNPTMTAPGG